jgi:hypothetical protein
MVMERITPKAMGKLILLRDMRTQETTNEG